MKVRNDTVSKSKKHVKLRNSNTTMILTFMALPTIIYMIIFNYIPLYGLILPFKNFNASKGLFGSDWCGFENFKFLFGGNSILVPLRNTIIYNILFILIGTAFCIIIALMLFEVSKGYVKFFQTSFLLPYFISFVAVSFIVNVFLDMDAGILNSFIMKLGGERVMWYNDPKYWPIILTISHVWKGFGYTALIYYAALMGLDKSVFEAATIDGASKLQQVWYISIPLIKSNVILMFILSVGKIFNSDFGLFYNVPLNSPMLYPATDVVDTFVYRALTQTGDIGMASAAGMMQSLAGFILVVITNYIVSKLDSDNAMF